MRQEIWCNRWIAKFGERNFVTKHRQSLRGTESRSRRHVGEGGGSAGIGLGAGRGRACDVLGAGSGARRGRRQGPARPIARPRPPSLSPIATRQLASGPMGRGACRLVLATRRGNDDAARRHESDLPLPGVFVIPTLARPSSRANWWSNQWIASCCLLACLIIFYPAGGMSLLVAVTVSKHSSWITLPGVSRLSQWSLSD